MGLGRLESTNLEIWENVTVLLNFHVIFCSFKNYFGRYNLPTTAPLPYAGGNTMGLGALQGLQQWIHCNN